MYGNNSIKKERTAVGIYREFDHSSWICKSAVSIFTKGYSIEKLLGIKDLKKVQKNIRFKDILSISVLGYYKI